LPTSRHYRLTLADALSAHERALYTGGRDGILNLHLIESALARPYSGYYRSMAQKAAALAQSMATNHGFADGNQRTTLILTDTLITRSGYELVAVEGDIEAEIEELLLSVAAHMPFEEIVRWFKDRLRKTE
jgi:death-on-curing protein